MGEGSPARVPCPTCGALYRWSPALVGRKIRCAKCQDVMRMPAAPDRPALLVRKAGDAVPDRAPGSAATPGTAGTAGTAETATTRRPAPATPAPAETIDQADIPVLSEALDPTVSEHSAARASDDEEIYQLTARDAPAATSDASPPAASLDNDPASNSQDPAPSRDGAYDLSLDDPPAPPARPRRTAAAPAASSDPPRLDEDPLAAADGPGEPATCPSCQRTLKPNAQICVDCGINIKTGRPLITAEKGDVEQIYTHAHNVIAIVSFLPVLCMGLFPISSEARGAYRPLAIWGISLVTIAVSLVFLGFEYAGSDYMHQLKNLLLWVGDGKPNPDMLTVMYDYTAYGDRDAFEAKLGDLETAQEKAKYAATTRQADDDGDAQAASAAAPRLLTHGEMVLAAHNALSPDQRALGSFHWWQLITHALLHSGFVHLAGNLIFLIVLGTRVNALVGNLGSLILYVVLGVAAAGAYALVSWHDAPISMLGASGAIMGIAGMYLVLFPVHKVHFAVWFRPIGLFPMIWLLVILSRFRLLNFWCWRFTRIWRCRGFWILAFFVGSDIFFVAIARNDHTAHWAHLGGFAAGALLAVLLLVTRGINGRGADLISVVLGRHAWHILGRPTQWAERGTDEGWLQRLRFPTFGKRSANPAEPAMR